MLLYLNIFSSFHDKNNKLIYRKTNKKTNELHDFFQIIKLIVSNGNFFPLAYTKILPYLE
jgi:hypothetical protein